MGDFDAILDCRIGASSLAGFTATDYSYTAEPQVREGVGRTGTKWSLEVEGYVSGADATELAARMRAIEVACSVGRRDVVLLGPGGVVEVALLSSLAVDGGPHVTVAFDARGALTRTVQLSGEGLLGLSEDWELPPPRYTERTATDVADRPTVTRRGTVSPRSQTTSRQAFERFVLPAFQRDYPRRPADGSPGWVVTHDYEEDASGRSGTYGLSATRLASPLPLVDTQTSRVLDGTVSRSEERDDLGRRVRTTSVDLLVAGDARAVYEQVRALVTAGEGQVGKIIRERIETTEGRDARLRGTFTMLLGQGATALVEFSQQLESEGEEPVIATKYYPGIGPVLYAESQRATVVVQSGRAVGLGVYPIPPLAIFPEVSLSRPRMVTRRRLNDQERETSWSYTYLFRSAPAITAATLALLDTPPQAGSAMGVGNGGGGGQGVGNG